MTRRVNVDRMRRYRKRTRSGPACDLCRTFDREVAAAEDGSAKYAAISRRFNHYVNGHYLLDRGMPPAYPHGAP